MGVEVKQQAIRLDRLAAQQVINVQLAHIAQAYLARGNVAQTRQSANRDYVRFQVVENVVAPLTRHAAQCQQHIGDG
jgi:hypothetical protein